MLVEVIDDNASMIHAFGRALGEQFDNLVVVNACVIPDGKDGHRTDYKGLDIAFKQAQQGKSVILYGFESENAMMRHTKFMELMGMKNVGYIRAPFLLEDLRKICAYITSGTKIEDVVAQALGAEDRKERLMSRLVHDEKYIDGRGQQYKETWFELARGIGFGGTDEEVRTSVLNWKRQTKGRFAGQYFPGVFIDIYGTLLNTDGSLNQVVKDKVEADLADKYPITLWTDSDLKETAKILTQLGVSWKLVSKFDFAGAEVEIAFDDLSPLEFEQQYQIKVRKFFQV